MVTPQDLIPGVYDAVERQLPTPVPVIAPADRNANGYADVQNHTYFSVEQTPCPGAPPASAPNASPAGFDGCGSVYRDSSAMAPNGQTYPVTVTIVWHATWQASTGAGGDLGRLSTTSTTRDLPVAEIQAVVTQG